MVELFDDGVVVVRCNSLRFSNFDVMVARAFASGYGVGIVLPLTNRLPFLPTWRISNVLIADKTKFLLSKLLSMPCLKYVFGIFLEIISSRRQSKKKSRVWQKFVCVCVYDMKWEEHRLCGGVLSHSVAYNFYLTTFCFQNILDSVVVVLFVVFPRICRIISLFTIIAPPPQISAGFVFDLNVSLLLFNTLNWLSTHHNLLSY